MVMSLLLSENVTWVQKASGSRGGCAHRAEARVALMGVPSAHTSCGGGQGGWGMRGVSENEKQGG